MIRGKSNAKTSNGLWTLGTKQIQNIQWWFFVFKTFTPRQNLKIKGLRQQSIDCVCTHLSFIVSFIAYLSQLCAFFCIHYLDNEVSLPVFFSGYEPSQSQVQLLLAWPRPNGSIDQYQYCCVTVWTELWRRHLRTSIHCLSKSYFVGF